MLTKHDAKSLIEIAASIGVTLALPPGNWGYEGNHTFVVRRHPRTHWNIAVTRMLSAWRILECDERGTPNGRYWCYPLNAGRVWLTVVTQANTYDNQPAGWVKSHNGPARPARRR